MYIHTWVYCMLYRLLAYKSIYRYRSIDIYNRFSNYTGLRFYDRPE